MPDGSSRRGTHVRVLTAALVVLAVLSGAVLALRPGSLPAQGAPAPSSEGPGRAGASNVVDRPPAAVRVPRRPGAPSRLVVPSLDVDARVVPVALRGTTLVPPADPQQLGWWADGAMPGAARGSALLSGHTVHTGGGALDDLETLPRGARVVVHAGGRRLAYRVTRVQVVTKDELARQAERLFDQTVPGRLVLVTCEDWDGTSFASNVVVTAVPAR